MTSSQKGKIKAGVPVLCWDERCKKSFLWVPKQDSDTPPAYHSKSCQRKNAEARKKWVKRDCPTPNKRAYQGPVEAERAEAESNRKGHAVRSYQCRCLDYHLGRQSYVVLEGDA